MKLADRIRMIEPEKPAAALPPIRSDRKVAAVLKAPVVLDKPVEVSNKPLDTAFDKKAYQREYMRKRRAAAKGAK